MGKAMREVSWEEWAKVLMLQPGDILLVNAEMVDVEELMRIQWPQGTPNVPVIPLLCERGQSLDDAMKTIPRERAIELLGQIVKGAEQEKCLCYFAIKDFDGIHHDSRCSRARL